MSSPSAANAGSRKKSRKTSSTASSGATALSAGPWLSRPTADESKVEANYENGLLQVTVRKAEIAKPKKITVTVGGGEPKTVEATATEQK